MPQALKATPHEPVALFDPDAIIVEFQKLATSYEGELRTAIAHRLKAVLAESRAKAEKLLAELLAEEPPSAETCGIAAGLAKRRFARFLTAGQRARSGVPLATMIRLYRMGFEAEPWDYYVGINLIASLRLRGQRFSATGDDDLAEARSLLPVVRLMVRRLPPQMRTFWPTVTRAELVLHEYLLDHPDGGPAEPVISAYSEALAHEHPPDYEKAAYDQLDIFRRAGDPPEFIAAVQEVFPSRPAQ